MHESGLHCYNPTGKSVVLINTVSKINRYFSREKITGQIKQTLFTPNLGIHQFKISGGLFKDKNSRLYCEGPIYWNYTWNLGQNKCGFKRKDHEEETNPRGRGHFYDSQGTRKTPQRCIYDSRNIIFKWNILFYFAK